MAPLKSPVARWRSANVLHSQQHMPHVKVRAEMAVGFPTRAGRGQGAEPVPESSTLKCVRFLLLLQHCELAFLHVVHLPHATSPRRVSLRFRG